MSENNYLGDDDLIYNTSSRLPVCLCLDISGSMQQHDAIDQLNKGVQAFYESIKSNEQAHSSCEICVITFNGEVTVEEDFSSVDNMSTPKFKAEGGTALAHAINKGLDLLDARKESYKENGIDYYQPWLVIITDGKPGDKEDVPAAQERTKALIEDKKLTLWPLAVGNDENEAKYHEIMDVLRGFCGTKRGPIHLKDLKFEDFFEWLGKSVAQVSASQVGETVKLDTSTFDDWGEI